MKNPLNEPTRPLWVEPIKADLRGDLTLYSIPPPGSGVLLAYIMKILDGLELHKTGSKDPLTYHRIAEAFKYAYAQRTKLGDPLFVPEVKQVTWSNERRNEADYGFT